jgi:hypothetical protein
MELPITNVINVTISDTPQGLQERNVNSLAIFTTETPGNLDAYRTYVSPAQVIEDYGSSSVTAKMANAIFAQTPNIRTGKGRLVIIPLDGAVSATQGNFVTANLSSVLSDILLVDNGDIKITVDGVAHNLTGLDFTNCEDLADVADVLQSKLNDAIVTSTTTTFTIISKKVGEDSTVAMAAVSGGTGTDLSGSGYFKASTGTATDGDNASGETLVEAITRTKAAVSYTGIITNLNMEDAVIEDTADSIQAQDLIFLHHFASPTDIAGIATTIKTASNTKTRCLLYTNGLAEANLMKSAYAGRAFSVNYSGSDTAQTMNLKALATITPDNGITQTLYDAAKTAGVDLYVSYDGVPSVLNTGGNEYFNNVYENLALKFALETAGFNFLRQTSTKIPQTEQGMNGLKGAYRQVLERFITNGSIAPGSWTSSERFGDPELFDENILANGYYIYSLPIAEQNASEREQRIAPLIQIAIKRAGAIHSSDVIVVVND